jgi:hypothetical protein
MSAIRKMLMCSTPIAKTPVAVLQRSSVSGQVTSSNATPTFNNVAIGNPSPTRRVLALISAEGPFIADADINAVTISTIEAVRDAFAIDKNGTNPSSQICAIYSATVPTGTTAAIKITFNKIITRAAVVAIALDNLVSPTPAAIFTGIGAASSSFAIKTIKDGYTVSIGTTTQDTTFTWTTLTERFDSHYGQTSAFSTFSGADLLPTISQDSLAITATPNARGVRQSIAAASYR